MQPQDKTPLEKPEIQEEIKASRKRIPCQGRWEWDIRKGTHYWSDDFYRILGLQPRGTAATFEAFLDAIHPDDREGVRRINVESTSDPCKSYAFGFRIIRPDGAQRDIYARTEIVSDGGGESMHMIGTIHDITDTKGVQEELKKALEEIKRLKEQIESENVYLREEMESTTGFAGILGVSNSIQYVKYRIRQVARTRMTVLLTGETGTGKGLFARAVHKASDRKDKLFVNVNCAGLPPNLIESELFGREKGAFTGSSSRQIGRFELADKGTLFLDEIGELPLELQAKLLRVIEDGEFERLGNPHPVKVDVRIIASTNRHLEEEVRKGRFRKDLYYRLHVFPITIPPLRQRKEDVPLLVRFFTDKFSQNHSRNITGISPDTMKSLERYDWPGNVRELMNVIERSIITSNGPELELAEPIDESPPSHVADMSAEHMDAPEAKGLMEVERNHILRTLRDTGWRIDGDKGAARHLGMKSSTIRARMKKLGIRRPGLPKSGSSS
jgi:formate hydrogenlyase transcriptional activator